jgi:phage terminase large subunit-like protein
LQPAPTRELDRLRYLRELKTRLANAHRDRWLASARPEQLTPDGDWNVWLILAGRGWGKTRTGAEDLADYARRTPGARLAVVAPTIADARDTCVEGESGLLAVLDPDHVDAWNRSLGELRLTNGTRIKTFSADEPDRLRGPQHHRAWCDEVAAWRYPEAWDQLMFGLRLGTHPRVIATTTPKPVKLIRDLAGRDDVHMTRGSTFDNAANLSPAAIAQLESRYVGTTLGRQELYGELLEQIPGALWTREMIERSRVDRAPDLRRIVVAVDPAVTSGEDSDETGIVVVGIVGDQLYVLDDASDRLPPEGWARRVVELRDEWGADRVVAEVNNGGDLVASVLRAVDRNVPLKLVRASRGKRTRAEPVSALYEQGRVHHVGGFDLLEDQLCTWTSDAKESPDRLDALVWAATELALDTTKQSRAVYSVGRGRL